MNRFWKRTFAAASVGAALMISTSVPPAHADTFAIGQNDFLLNGKPFVIRSGEMHFNRVPKEYWRQRLQMMKAMGLNTVCAYMFWNAHEAKEGQFDFTGQNDVAEYCRLAQAEGLHVILRPGPYACAEWEFGGFPSWLLKTPDIKLRTRDPRYLAPVRRYLLEVGKHLAPLQVTKGGPILMVQVENEYGSYGSDKEYMGIVRDNLKAAGFDVPLFHCDGPSQLPADHRDDIFAVVNFGSDPKGSFEALRKVQPTGPLMCGEYYPGWFDHWGERHHKGDSTRITNELKYMLDNKASFSIYMAHGGTSFGFTAGSNSPPFSPTETSYDYDAPINENGGKTEKFDKLRELFSHYLQPGETLPPIPATPKQIAIAPFNLSESAPVMDKLPKPIVAQRPITFELLDQQNALVLYRTTVPAGPEARLVITKLHDYGHIYLDGKKVATLDRRRDQSATSLPARAKAMTLDILVDTFGRVNYGGDIHDRKGITEKVELVNEKATKELLGWSHYKLPLDKLALQPHPYKKGAQAKPAFYRGNFNLNEVGDTFLDTSKWNKGVVWINGHNLGRYWQVGPQQTLYVPAPWLKQGRNEVVVYEGNGLEAGTAPMMQGVTTPVLDEPQVEPDRAHRKKGQNLAIDEMRPVLAATLENNAQWQTFKLPAGTTGRYITLESLNSHSNDAYASLAEIYVQGADGKDLSRSAWKVVYADSEEFGGENGSADNLFDLQATTIWHTRWSGSNQPTHPHQVVIDLGAPTTISAVRLLQRPGTQATPPARIKDFRFFVSPNVPPGL